MKKRIIVFLISFVCAFPLLVGWNTDSNNCPYIKVKSNVTDYDEIYFAVEDVQYLSIKDAVEYVSPIQLINKSNKLIIGYLNGHNKLYIPTYGDAYFYVNDIELDEFKTTYVIYEVIECQLSKNPILTQKDKIYISISLGFLFISLIRLMSKKERRIK